MTKRVKAGSHSNNTKPFAYDLKITKKISLSDLSAMLRTKDKTVAVGGEMTVKELAQLNAHWYESLLIALSFDKKRKRVEIHLFARKTQQLLNPHSGIKRRKRKGF